MSFKPNDINLNNYEEFFILYMDGELNTSGQSKVEEFIALHPHLAEELQILMSTKLPLEEVSLFNKEDLYSAAMQMNIAEESLLLYIDNELPASEKTSVEEKINSNKDFALQHSVLMQTKLDASEKIKHPNKKELYRHTEKVIHFKVWTRVAAAIVIILFGSLFFLLDSNTTVSDPPIVIKNPTQLPKTKSLPEEKNTILPEQKEEPVLVKVPEIKKNDGPAVKNIIPSQDKKENGKHDVALENNNDQFPVKREITKFDVARFTVNPDIDPLNKTITHTAVTSFSTPRTIIEDAPEAIDMDADFKPTKKGSTKGLLRKVTRFIERNTGIGTVNADNELLIGAVSLKLK